MEMALDTVWMFNLLPVRILDFKAVNKRPGAIIFWEYIDPPDVYIPEPAFDVELTQLREYKLALTA